MQPLCNSTKMDKLLKYLRSVYLEQVNTRTFIEVYFYIPCGWCNVHRVCWNAKWGRWEKEGARHSLARRAGIKWNLKKTSNTGVGQITSVQLSYGSVSCYGFFFLVGGWGLFLSWLALEVLMSVQSVDGTECWSMESEWIWHWFNCSATVKSVWPLGSCPVFWQQAGGQAGRGTIWSVFPLS